MWEGIKFVSENKIYLAFEFSIMQQTQINKKDRLALTITTYTLIGLACRSLQEGDSPKDWPFTLKGAMLENFIFCRFMTKYSF